MHNNILLPVLFILTSILGAVEQRPSLPTGWEYPLEGTRAFRPHAMLDLYPDSKDNDPRIIEVDILNQLPLPEKQGELSDWTWGGITSRISTDFFLINQKQISFDELKRQSEKATFDASWHGLKVYSVIRAIIAIDPSHPDSAKLFSKDNLIELQNRLGKFYTNFPSPEWLKGSFTAPGGKRNNEEYASLFINEESEWPGRALEPSKGHWSPGNEIPFIDTAPSRFSAVSVTLERLITAWQADCGIPYQHGPGPITRTWLWHDTWWDREAPDFLSHLEWRSQQENVRTGLPVWTIVNTTDVKPTTGVDWATRMAGLKPHLITIRPSVPENQLARPQRPDLPNPVPIQPGH